MYKVLVCGGSSEKGQWGGPDPHLWLGQRPPFPEVWKGGKERPTTAQRGARELGRCHAVLGWLEGTGRVGVFGVEPYKNSRWGGRGGF